LIYIDVYYSTSFPLVIKVKRTRTVIQDEMDPTERVPNLEYS